MYNKNDISFDHKEVNEYQGESFNDYWFKINGKTCEEVTHNHMEQAMICINSAVYSTTDDMVGIRKIFPFSSYVDESHDEKLNVILKELVNEIES